MAKRRANGEGSIRKRKGGRCGKIYSGARVEYRKAYL